MPTNINDPARPMPIRWLVGRRARLSLDPSARRRLIPKETFVSIGEAMEAAGRVSAARPTQQYEVWQCDRAGLPQRLEARFTQGETVPVP